MGELRQRALEAERVEAERREAQRLAAEEAQCRAAEEAQHRTQEEAERVRREEEAAAERARLEEIERLAKERERKATVDAFLNKYAFSGVCAPKKTWRKTSYAIHKAAKLGDDQLVRMLLEEGALKNQKDSRGETAVQIAEKHNKAGSHANVLSVLGVKATPKAGGA